MGRGKLTLELIKKEKARMITYQKRKRGLKKKAEEFATLCGVPTCMIIFGPRLNNRPGDVEVWPKDHNEFMEVVNLYRDKAYSSVRGVKSQNLYDFFADRNRKVYEKIVKTRKANFESKFSSDLDEDMINNLSMHQLKEMLIVFDNNIDVATRKLALLKGYQNSFGCYNNNYVGAQVLFQQPQPLASHHLNMQLDPFNHQALQMVPFEFNPVDNPMMKRMMLMNGGDQMGSIPYNHPTIHALCYDPMGAVIENRVVMNNQRAVVRLVGSTMQQLQPYDQFPALPSIDSQVHGSQFNGFYGDISEFHHKR